MALIQKEIKKVYLGNTLIRPTWWDMNNWELSQTSSALSGTWWGWVFFNTNGTKLFLTKGNYVYEISLNRRYDLSNLSFNKYINLASGVEDIHFNPDGTKMYVIRSNPSYRWEVAEYNLSTAWDISTAVLWNNLKVWGDSRWLYINPEWTKLFVSDGYSTYTQLWNLSTPRDLSTADSWTQVTSTYWGISIRFSPDGTMFFTQNGEYTSYLTYVTLSTPRDLSTAITSWIKNIGKCRAWWIWFDNDGIMCVMVWWWSSTNYVTKYTL